MFLNNCKSHIFQTYQIIVIICKVRINVKMFLYQVKRYFHI